MVLSEEHQELLTHILEEFKEHDLKWVLAGSTALKIQGMDYEPNDIDIHTDKKSAYQIDQILREYRTDPVSFQESKHHRSYFGQYKAKGITIEVAGEIQEKTGDYWTKPVDLDKIKEHTEFKGHQLSVISLEYAEKFYRRMDRKQKADEIREFLENHS